MRPAIIRKLHKIGERVLVKNEGELLVVGRPVGDLRCDVEEDFKADLLIELVGLSLQVSGLARLASTHPGDGVSRLPKIRTPLHGVRPGQVILNQPQANVVAHLIELLVDFHIVAIEILH